MPSGATHDRITLWSLPLVTGATLAITRSSELTLWVAGGFLFGGLMLSPDLDLRSRPFRRWGWFRWLWIPYQKSLHHRSFISHGVLIGTVVRVIYLLFWIAVFGFAIGVIAVQFSAIAWGWTDLGEWIGRTLKEHRWSGLALFVGLELGSISHILGDHIGSTYKRYQKYGWSGLWKKRPSRKRAPRRRSTARKPTKRKRSNK